MIGAADDHAAVALAMRGRGCLETRGAGRWLIVLPFGGAFKGKPAEGCQAHAPEKRYKHHHLLLAGPLRRLFSTQCPNPPSRRRPVAPLLRDLIANRSTFKRRRERERLCNPTRETWRILQPIARTSIDEFLTGGGAAQVRQTNGRSLRCIPLGIWKVSPM
jgi:hypothetical protein